MFSALLPWSNDQERLREIVSQLEATIWSEASSHEEYTKRLQRRISRVQSQPPPQPTEAPPPAAAAQPALSAAAPPPSNRKSRATNSNSAGPSAPAAAASSAAPSGSGSAAFNAIAAAAPAPPPPKPQFGPPPPSAFFQIPPVERPFRDAAAQYWSLVAKYRKRIDKKAVEDFQKKLVARLNQKTEEERKNERPEVGNRATQLRKDIEEFMKRLYVEKEPKNLSHAAISGPKGVADILRLNELQYAVEKAVILATANNNAGRVSPAPKRGRRWRWRWQWPGQLGGVTPGVGEAGSAGRRPSRNNDAKAPACKRRAAAARHAPSGASWRAGDQREAAGLCDGARPPRRQRGLPARVRTARGGRQRQQQRDSG